MRSCILKCFMVWILGILAVSKSGGQVILYVDNDSAPAGSGLTWSTALVHLQDALRIATGFKKVGLDVEIRVAQGTYRPDLGVQQAAGDRNASFDFVDGVTIRGGYAGFGQSTPDARDFSLYPTILSGDIGENDQQGTVWENSRRIANVYVSSPTVLEGLVFKGGNNDCCGGGAALMLYGPAQMVDCRFTHNRASATNGTSVRVGGDANFLRCEFASNTASTHGGAVYVESGVPAFNSCIFRANVSAGYGGAVYSVPASGFFQGCEFVDNIAQDGGAICIAATSGTVAVEQSQFTGNVANADGGALRSFGALIRLVRVDARDNFADSRGGAVASEGSAEVVACQLLKNRASFGGALVCRGGSATGSTFVGNSAIGRGGAIGLLPTASEFKLVNCSVVGCQASIVGGGISVLNARASVDSSILAFNVAILEPSTSDVSSEESEVGLCNSCIPEGWSGIGESNIVADPQFADADGLDNIYGTEDDDIRLSAGSPCIDAGNGLAYFGPLLDIELHSRTIDDPGSPNSGVGFPPLDIGALEFVPDHKTPPCVADVNQDNHVNGADLSIFLAQFGMHCN